ncbi:MAG TPA: ferric reductase-like transmembrane domain-containing protein [Euzebyales bacterium]|nr:ferric reductase-like transmembrane domain-containing protein [Euzebyales bacterium]
MNPQTWWFVSRASGLVAYALLGAAVIGGLLLSTRLLGRRPAPDWVLDWHRFVGGLAVVFTLLHLAALLADDYIEFRVIDLVVPGIAPWRPVALAWGVIGFYLLLAVQLTSLLRERLPATLWRRVHYLSLPLFALATVHTLTAGTDAAHPLVLVLVGGVTAAVLLLLAFRSPWGFILRRRAGRR